jgi:L-ascorbate metabolism protein UlaG (beta-lactamase superfamily)
VKTKITFLGQAGLCFDTGGKKIVVDPYLSNSVGERDAKKNRRQPIHEEWLNIKPDILVFTHNHLDHYDEQTVKGYLSADTNALVLAPRSVWDKVRLFGGENNYVQFQAGTKWTENGVTFQAVKAEHSDADAIGVVITIDNENYYVTGDTLYNQSVFDSLPSVEFKAVFLPINGVGNNMNAFDAALFAEKIKARNVVPVHFGLFDDMTGKELKLGNTVIPKIYKEIQLK